MRRKGKVIEQHQLLMLLDHSQPAKADDEQALEVGAKHEAECRQPNGLA
jgi:hypothetical protein